MTNEFSVEKRKRVNFLTVGIGRKENLVKESD